MVNHPVTIKIPDAGHLHLVAPSGYCQNQSAAWRGVSYFETHGFRVTGQSVITRRWQRFAGTDIQRLSDWQKLPEAPQLPNIVLAVKGGYGASRLIPQLDYSSLANKLRSRPVMLCGHSDFNAIQLALLRHSGLISFSAPMLATNFGAEPPSQFTLTHFWRALTSPQFTLEWQTSSPRLSIEGHLWGGNLSILASLAGTPWLPDIEGGILVIEDVNESVYRIERMLLQLAQSGILAKQLAIIAGDFTGHGSTPAEDDNGYNLDEVWKFITRLTGVPVVTGLAFGHNSDTVTLPLGARGQLCVSGTTGYLTLAGHPTFG